MFFKIKSNDNLIKIHNSGVGFVYNDYSGKTIKKKNDNVLHAASCYYVTTSKTNIKKYYFSTKKEALNWLKENRGDHWRRCGICDALGQDDIEEINKYLIENNEEVKNSNIQTNLNTIFYEAKAQEILVNHLRKNKYNVEEQCRVPNGIVDIVAKNNSEKIVIEVKGEDKGGYNSAEMNFQMGIGQIISRMISTNAKYAICFPLTINYKKVLYKFKNTYGFKKLDLNFYVIETDGTVKEFTSSKFTEFIKNIQD